MPPLWRQRALPQHSWACTWACVAAAAVASPVPGTPGAPGAAGAASERDGAPPRRQSPSGLAGLWDAQALASFSAPQLEALARIAQGWCPLLSRAVKCARHGGRRKRAGGPARRTEVELDLELELVEAYLGEEAELARRHTVAMMRHIWTNYEKYAFGKDELKPLTGRGTNSWGGLGQTLVDSLDTLWLMGLQAEFGRAATWVEHSLSFDKDVNVNLFETSIRQLGGLIAAYAFSRREGLLAKAKDLGNRLLKAFAIPPKIERRDGVTPKGAERESRSAGIVADILRQVGLSKAAMDAILGGANDELEAPEDKANVPAMHPVTALPFSDVNLKTGKVENLAKFVSLAEAYVPIEWKALALFTGNCSYARPQDEVLHTVNRTTDLEGRGLAPILLQHDGSAMPVLENRISLGSRGDSFYEYLLKDSLWSGPRAGALQGRLWRSFRAQLPSLLVRADPAAAARAVAARAAAPRPRSRRRRRRRRAPAAAPAPAPVPAAQGEPAARRPRPRGVAGAAGGWFESWRDAAGPWLFLREVGHAQTIPKIDHLVCFLPGTLALDVLRHRGARAGGSQGDAAGHAAPLRGHGVSDLPPDRLSELLLAEKLLQTCVHMYFRTASDLAPEITRFNALGLVDDLGSMHNILRPETVESLFILWRTTKSQVYRNWGQRLLTAFGRMKTPYGYASLHNVNRPWDLRDDMPSYFVAETVKYLFLLFAEDSVLSLEDMVITTEAHPLPTINAAMTHMNVEWTCGGGKPQEAGSEISGSWAASRQSAGQLGKGVHAESAADAPVVDSTGTPAAAPAAAATSPGVRERAAPPAPPAPPAPLQSVVATGAAAHEAATPEASARGLEESGREGAGDGGGACEACEARERELASALARAEAELALCAGALARTATVEVVPAPGPAGPTALGAASHGSASAPQGAGAGAGAGEGDSGDPACWVGGFTPRLCCSPPPSGNPACWDGDYTYERCCGARRHPGPGGQA